MLRRDALVELEGFAHVGSRFKRGTDDVKGQPVDAGFLAVVRRIDDLLIFHFPAEHVGPILFITALDTKPDRVTPGLGSSLAKLLVHHLHAGVDRKRKTDALFVNFEERSDEFQIRQKQLIPEFEIADIVFVTQSLELRHHGLRLILAQKFLFGAPPFQNWRVAAVGAAIGAATTGHNRQHQFPLGTKNGRIYILEPVFFGKYIVIRKRQRLEITDLMRFSLIDFAIHQFFPHAVCGAVFEPPQVLHNITDRVLTVTDTDVVNVRVCNRLFLRQHGLVTTNADRQVRHQLLDLLEIRLHRIPVGAHDGERHQIRVQCFNGFRVIFRRVLLSTPEY